MRRAIALILVLPALVLIAGCGGDDKDQGNTDIAVQQGKTDDVPTTPQTAEAKPGKSEGGDPKDLKKKPAVTSPGGEPPAKLESKDIVKGKGKAAKSGDTVSVQYVGVLFDGAKEFDASWDRGEPFEFQLGAGMVIPGWDQGVAGMKEGGRRQLTIPSDLAYGDQGQPPTIPPAATLIFIVDLKKVK